MDAMDTGMRHCLHLTVGISATIVCELPTFFDPIRYPANIPQGTAVPPWAYYDITVSNTRTI